jgi:hypothetical protein
LGCEAVAHFRHRVTVLDLLVRVPTLVRDFDYEFRHLSGYFHWVSKRNALGSV